MQYICLIFPNGLTSPYDMLYFQQQYCWTFLYSVFLVGKQMDPFIHLNGDVTSHSSTRVNLEQNGGRRQPEITDTGSKADLRLLLETTTTPLSCMALMAGICDNAKSNRRKLLQSYSTITLLALFGFFAWQVSKNYDIHLLVAIQVNTSTLQGIAHFAIFYTLSFIFNCLSGFFETWQTYRNTYSVGTGSIKFKSNVCITLIVALTVLYTIFDGYTSFMRVTPNDVCDAILSALDWLVGIYRIFAWMASSGFMMLIVNLLSDEYRLISKQIQEASQQGPHRINRCIGDIRRRHWELTRVVDKADDIFCAHVGLSFLASFVLSCVGLYLIIWDRTLQGSAILEIIRVLKVLMALAKLTSDCIAGVNLNNAVSICIL